MQARILVTSLLIAFSGAAMAQASAPKVATSAPKAESMQAEKQKPAMKASAENRQTRRENAEQAKRDGKMKALEDAAKADGKVTGAERKKLLRAAVKDSKEADLHKTDETEVVKVPRQ